VFVAYAGSNSEAVAVDMAKCLSERGLRAHIAVPGLKESINIDSENAILNFELKCQAVFAVGTDGAANSPKFVDEIEAAKYRKDDDGRYDPIPVIAFMKENASDIPLVLTTGCSRIRFGQGRHKSKCREASEMIRYKIREQVNFEEQPASTLDHVDFCGVVIEKAVRIFRWRKGN